MHVGTILGPKSFQKLYQNLDRFLMRFGIDLGTIWGAFLATLGVQGVSWRGLLEAFWAGSSPKGSRDRLKRILAPFWKGVGSILKGLGSILGGFGEDF